MKNIASISAIMSLAAILTGCTPQVPQPPTPTPINAPTTAEINPFIRVSTPKPNDIIASPLTILGEARGTWYFEATFPIEIADATGNIIGTGFAQAQGDWMTENFVPFIATVTFNAPTTTTGMVILKKDNPSGLPEYDRSILIPIKFASGRP